MLSPFRRVSLRGAQSGQDAPKASPIDLAVSRPDRAASASLLDDVRSPPTGKTVEDGCLVN